MDDHPARPFSLRFAFRGRVLEATLEGRIDGNADAIPMFLALAAEVRRTAVERLLVIDHSEGVVPDEAGLHELVAALEGQGLVRARLAYVDVRGTAIGRLELGEIVGREHGYDVRVFDNEQRARIWLNYGQS
ncbi:MAG: hypothetical protein QM719_13040 [Thermomonas sp.]